MKDIAALLMLILAACVLGARQERERIWWWYTGLVIWKMTVIGALVVGTLGFSVLWLLK